MIGVAEILREIKPVVLRWIEDELGGAGLSTGTPGAPSPHPLDSVHHSGLLSDVQATQFLKTDGSRALIGNLAVGSGVTIDGVDISVLAASVAGMVPNTRQIISGAGLVGGGDLTVDRTLDVGAGNGITVNANDVAVDATVARNTWPVNAGAGLTGGGNLASAGITLDVGSGAGITVNADNIQLNLNYAAVWTAVHEFQAGIKVTGSITGLGAGGGEILLGTTAASVATSIGDFSPGSPVLFFDHRAVNNTGFWQWRNGTDASLVRMALSSAGSLTLDGDLAVNGGDLTTSQTTFNLLQTTATTVNAFGAATSMRLGSSTALAIGVNKNSDSQFDLDLNGSFRAGGYIVGKHAIQLPGALLILHFDGQGPFTPPLTNFSGNPTGHLGQAPTIGAPSALLFAPGKFGKALYTSGFTDNYVLNPSAEGAGNFAALGAATVTADSTFPLLGAKSYKVVTTAAAGDGLNLTTGAFPNVVAWCTFYIRGTVPPSMQISMNAGTNWNSVSAIGSGIDVTGSWTRYKGPIAAAQANGSTSFRIRQNDTTVRTFYIDCVQVEQPNVEETNYYDASLGSGTWGGTAHASTSHRYAPSLYYSTTNMLATGGSVGAWFMAGNIGSNSDGYQTIMRFDGATGFWFLDLTNTRTLDCRWGSSSYGGGTTVTPYVWHHLVMTNDGTNTYVYLDGALVDSGPQGTALTVPPATFVVGSAGAQNWNGLIDDFFVLNRVMTAAEVRAVYESNAPVFAETSVFAFRDSGGGTWLDENGLFSKTTGATPVPNFALVAKSVNATILGGASETLDPGDLLLGDNNSSKANLFYDASAGKLNFRGGTTIQGYVDTNGAATFGAGAVLLNAQGLTLQAGASGVNQIKYMSGSTTYALLYGNAAGSSDGFNIQVSPVSGTHSANILLQASGGTTEADLFLKADANTNTGYTAIYGGVGWSGLSIGKGTAALLGLDLATFNYGFTDPRLHGYQWVMRNDSELVTVASGVTTQDTTFSLPADAVILAVTVYVSVQPGNTTTMTVTGAGSGTGFNTGTNVSTVAGSSNKGTKAGAFYNSAAQKIRLTFNAATNNANGRVRVAWVYYEMVAPTS